MFESCRGRHKTAGINWGPGPSGQSRWNASSSTRNSIVVEDILRILRYPPFMPEVARRIKEASDLEILHATTTDLLPAFVELAWSGVVASADP